MTRVDHILSAFSPVQIRFLKDQVSLANNNHPNGVPPTDDELYAEELLRMAVERLSNESTT